MRMSGSHYSNTDLINKYLYNGKELQEQTNYLDYGFRQMDVQLGRWHVIDALAEKHLSTSGYAYTLNDPVNHTDLMGLTPWRSPNFVQGTGYAGTAASNFFNSPNIQAYAAAYGYASDGGGDGGGSLLSNIFDDYKSYMSSTTKFQRKNMSFDKWIFEQEKAATLAGFLSRQDALNLGYSFSKIKYKRVVGLGKLISTGGEVNVRETIAIDVAYIDVEDSFMSWVNSFNRPSGGLVLKWDGFGGKDSKTTRNPNVKSRDISGIMGVLGGVSEMDVAGWVYNLIFNYFTSEDKIQQSTVEMKIPNPILIDTIKHGDEHSWYNDSVWEIQYNNGKYINHIFVGDTTYIDTSFNWDY